MRRSAAGLKKVNRALLAGIGFICVGLGVIGAFLPLMPSTVFLIVAAWCFARSNPRLYRELRRHRAFAPVGDWQEGLGLSATAKVAAISSITLTFSLSIAFAVQQPLLRLVLAGFALGLVVYLLQQPTSRPLKPRRPHPKI